MSLSSPFRHFSPMLPFSHFSSKSISKSSQLLYTHFHLSPPSLLSKTQVLTAFCSSSFPISEQNEVLPPNLQSILREFQSVHDSRSKYEQLLFYGRNLPALDARYKNAENKVQGCVSQVWVRAFLDTERNVWFEADSDSSLTKGLAALLVKGLSGRPATEIARVPPDFVQLLGLQKSLTPSRNNGFLNMLRLMQKKALELDLGIADNEESVREGISGASNSVQGLKSGGVLVQEKVEKVIGDTISSGDFKVEDVNTMNLNSVVNGTGEINLKSEGVINLDSHSNSVSEMKLDSEMLMGSRAQKIKTILEKELYPVELEVEDVSYQHAGHAGNTGADGETHFNLKIVSKEFEGKSLVKRHRIVYNLLQNELNSGLHALSIVAKTPVEAAGR